MRIGIRGSSGHLVTHVNKSFMEGWAERLGGRPGLNLTKSKSQWQNTRRDFAYLQAEGYLNPSEYPEKFEDLKRYMDAVESYVKSLMDKD